MVCIYNLSVNINNRIVFVCGNFILLFNILFICVNKILISVLIIITASGASSQSNPNNCDHHQQPATNQPSFKHNVMSKFADNQSNATIPLQALNAPVPLTSSLALNKAVEQGTKLRGQTVNMQVSQTLVSSSSDNDNELDELIYVSDSQPTEQTSSTALLCKSAVPSLLATTSASRAVVVTSANSTFFVSSEILDTVSNGNKTDNVTNACKMDTVSSASIKPCVVSIVSSNILSLGSCYSTSAAINSSIQPESKLSPLKCSQDDITKKRLEALKRREQSMMAKLGTCSASQVKRDWDREKETLKEMSSLPTSSCKGRVLPVVQHVMGKEKNANDNLQNDHVTLYSNHSNQRAALHSSHSNQHAALNNNISSKCTQEEIERKRQEAMKKKNTRLRIKNNQNNT